jgi:predicted lipid-binding transport protein (Tim44 family)
MQRRNWIIRSILLFTLLFGLAVPAVTAEARPGGGSRSSVGRSSGSSSRSSSGSSRSSSGSSSSSSRSSGGGGPIFIPGGGGGGGGSASGGEVLGFILFVVIVIIIIVVIMRVVGASRGRAGAGGPTYVDDLPPPTRADEIERWDQTDSEIEAGLADIHARDPGFDRARFIDRVQTAYMILNTAWVKQDLTPALPFLSEGQAQRLTMQLEADKARYQRNVMEDVVLSGVRVVRVDKDSAGDVIVARIDASAADYYIDVRTGQTTYGWHEPRPYTEYWTFSRSGAAKTGKASYLERACPNCGAPLELGNISVCQYCGTPVASTEYDWVLMTIDQKYTNE